MIRFIAIPIMLAGLIFAPVSPLLASPSAGADCGMQAAMPDGSNAADQHAIMPSSVKSAHSQHGGTSGQQAHAVLAGSMDTACTPHAASAMPAPSMPQNNPHVCCDMPDGGLCPHGGIGCSGVTCQTVPSLFMTFSTELSVATSYELVAPPAVSIFLSLPSGGLYRPPVLVA